MQRLMLICMPSEATQGMALVPVWGRGWFWVLLALLTMLPFFVAPLPMMPDLFSHMARYHVMNFGHESAFLRQYYDFEWQLVGNLGVDLLMVPLGHILPTEVAAKYLVMLIPPLTVAGIYAVAMTANGRITAPALLALPFVFSFTFMFGFVNYHLAVALALLVFALWIRTSAWSNRRRWLVFLPAAALIWLVHMAGWAVLLVLVAGWELPAVRASGSRRLNTALTTALKAAPLAMPAFLTLLWRSNAPSMGIMPASSLSYKIKALTNALRAESQWLDIASVILLGGTGDCIFGAAQPAHFGPVPAGAHAGDLDAGAADNRIFLSLHRCAAPASGGDHVLYQHDRRAGAQSNHDCPVRAGVVRCSGCHDHHRLAPTRQ